MTRCIFATGDCQYVEQHEGEPEPDDCIDCLLVAAKVSLEASLKSGDAVKSGYYIGIAMQMLRAVGLWAEQCGYEITAFDKKLPKPIMENSEHPGLAI